MANTPLKKSGNKRKPEVQLLLCWVRDAWGILDDEIVKKSSQYQGHEQWLILTNVIKKAFQIDTD